jgi:membrane protein YqaA with SNARE-associated domain
MTAALSLAAPLSIPALSTAAPSSSILWTTAGSLLGAYVLYVLGDGSDGTGPGP